MLGPAPCGVLAASSRKVAAWVTGQGHMCLVQQWGKSYGSWYCLLVDAMQAIEVTGGRVQATKGNVALNKQANWVAAFAVRLGGIMDLEINRWEAIPDWYGV